MNGFENEVRILKTASATLAVLTTMGLNACGGGGGDGANEVVSRAESPEATKIRAEGVSQQIDRNASVVDVMFPAVSWAADGSYPNNVTFGRKANQAISGLRDHGPGAYTSLPFGKKTIDLLSGTVTDIAGNGQFAIGRWTAGSDTTGHSYNANQGQAWAVGIPLSVSIPRSATMSCSLVAATRPTAGDGNTAPGKLDDASATLSNDGLDLLGQPAVNATLKLRYSIGNDIGKTFDQVASIGSVSMSRTTRASIMTMFAGTNPSNPYVIVSYGVHAPTVGIVNGIAVLNCR